MPTTKPTIKRLLSHVLWIALISLVLGACSSTGQMMDNLNQTLRSYERAIRWANFDAAYSFHKWEEGEQPTLPANMKNIKVTRYQKSSEKFDQKNLRMKQLVTVQYYNTSNLRERSMQIQQDWKYFPDLKRWYLMSDPITFK